jgi:hypothetical protein
MQTYMLVTSGMVRYGNGELVETMVHRMLRQTRQPATARCLNLVVETWCIAGSMKKAQKALERMQVELGCDADEETYALLAAGWAQTGKIRVASDVLLGLALKGYDSSKIDLNSIVFDWRAKKWRQVRGFEMKLPTVVKQQLTPLEEDCTSSSKLPEPAGKADTSSRPNMAGGRRGEGGSRDLSRPPSRASPGANSPETSRPSSPGTSHGNRQEAKNKDLWDKRIADEVKFQKGNQIRESS